MKKEIYLFIFLSALFFSCKKNSNDNANSIGSQNLNAQFTVGVADREDSYAVLSWTKAILPVKDSTITYTVKLSGTVLFSNLKDTSCIINNLVSTQSYQGQVIATNNKGATTTVNFFIDKNVGFIYINYRSNFNNNYFGCFTLSGKQVWGKLLSGISDFSAISNDTIFVACSGGALYALSTKNGTIFWSGSTSSDNKLSVLYHNGVVYDVNTSYITAFNAASGQQLWQMPINSIDLPTVGDGLLLNTSTGYGNQYYLDAYDWKTGLKKWSFKGGNGLLGHPSEYNNTAYIVGDYTTQSSGSDSFGKLYAIDSKTGLPKWTFSFMGSVGFTYNQSRPVVVGNTVCFSTHGSTYSNYNLYAVNAQNGSSIWGSGNFGNGYIMADSTGVFVSPGSGFLFKSDLRTGKKLWTINSTPFNIVITPDKVYSNGLSSLFTYLNPTPMSIYSNITGSFFTTDPPNNVSYSYMLNRGFVISINGKTYYPAQSGMYGVNY